MVLSVAVRVVRRATGLHRGTSIDVALPRTKPFRFATAGRTCRRGRALTTSHQEMSNRRAAERNIPDATCARDVTFYATGTYGAAVSECAASLSGPCPNELGRDARAAGRHWANMTSSPFTRPEKVTPFTPVARNRRCAINHRGSNQAWTASRAIFATQASRAWSPGTIHLGDIAPLISSVAGRTARPSKARLPHPSV